MPKSRRTKTPPKPTRHTTHPLACVKAATTAAAVNAVFLHSKGEMTWEELQAVEQVHQVACRAYAAVEVRRAARGATVSPRYDFAKVAALPLKRERRALDY